jgi:uracil-DNA glycosylase family 4
LWALPGRTWMRDDVYITNLTKFRPRTPTGHNRKPTGKESRAALPYLIRELQIVGPAVIVCLGGAAACALLQQPNLKMQQANGKTWRHDGRPLLVTYHPSPFNFYNPARRAALFAAFEELRALVAENTVGHKK